MEVDWGAIEEVKETSDGAHLTAGGSTNGRSEDFPMEINSGQMQILLWGYQGVPPRLTLVDTLLSCVCFYVGAPSAGECLKARVNDYGQQLCEICGTRLNKCQGKLYKKPPGLICHLCYNDPERTSRLPSAAPPPDRSHKRKQPPTGQLIENSALSIISLPSFPISLRNSTTWPKQRFQLIPANRARRANMTDWSRLVKETGSGAFNGWEEKRAGFYEQNMRQSLSRSILEQQRVRIVTSAENLARSLLHSLDVDESSLRMDDIECLRTDPKIGLQEVHADIQKHQYAASCYVVIFYLVETESTAVADVLTDELDSMWKGTIPQNIQRLKSVNFRTERVFVGDALIMTGATFHYGIANPDLYQRFVGFLSFTPKSLPPMDSQQQFYPIGIRDY
jgi:hypothetical protein